MIELTPQNLLVLAALLALLTITFRAPKVPFAWQRPLGYLALALGGLACACLLTATVVLTWEGDGRAAAEHFLSLYILATASWLAWKAAKPF